MLSVVCCLLMKISTLLVSLVAVKAYEAQLLMQVWFSSLPLIQYSPVALEIIPQYSLWSNEEKVGQVALKVVKMKCIRGSDASILIFFTILFVRVGVGMRERVSE